MATATRWLCRCFRHRLTGFPQVVHVRQFAIQPPEWLGGSIPKQILGPPLDEWKNFKERLEELNVVDAEVVRPVDVGVQYRYKRPSHRDVVRQWRLNRSDADLEREIRMRQFELSLDSVRRDWLAELGPIHMHRIAKHYGIYDDLFNGASFVPVVDLRVTYAFGDDEVTPVHCGNRIDPADAKTTPDVQFDSDDDGSFWSVVLTNPDGHLTDNESEYLHWFVGNIPGGGDVSQGEVLCDYLPPFPPRGTGLHRHVFLLFKHSQRLDFAAEKRPANCRSLKERSFRTVDFFRARQGDLTPMGIAFFQSAWDASVKDVYHNLLDMREPSFDYLSPPFYHPRPKRYPHKQPFDRYYDRYRDRKDLAEEVVKMKMAMTSPFSDYPQRVYPLIHRGSGYKPSWLRRREELMTRRREQFQDLPY